MKCILSFSSFLIMNKIPMDRISEMTALKIYILGGYETDRFQCNNNNKNIIHYLLSKLLTAIDNFKAKWQKKIRKQFYTFTLYGPVFLIRKYDVILKKNGDWITNQECILKENTKNNKVGSREDTRSGHMRKKIYKLGGTT